MKSLADISKGIFLSFAEVSFFSYKIGFGISCRMYFLCLKKSDCGASLLIVTGARETNLTQTLSTISHLLSSLILLVEPADLP